MQRKVLVSQFKALGFAVKDSGMVERDKVQFGYIGGTEFQTPDGRVVALETIEQVSCIDVESTIEFALSDGSRVSFVGGRMVMAEVGVPEARNMPKTTGELNAIFAELYPDCDMQLFYNVLQERDMVDMAIFGRPEEGIKPLSDKIQAIYHEHLENRLKTLGFQGRIPARQVMDEVIEIRTYDRMRNFFREWFESHEWDGVPRLHTWFQDTFGATAPALDPQEEKEYLADVAEAWFVGAVQRQYVKTRHEVVPVLIGDQGIGKGLGLRYTAGKDEWFIDTNTDVRDPARFLDGIRGRVIVELSESTQIKSNDMKLLKGFITKDEDQLRKAYAHHEEQYPRHFVLIATSNVDNIFTDPTGNRRFFPMYCDPSKATRRFSVDRKIGQYDVEQVWAEALHLYNNQGKYYISKKASVIARKMQEFCTVESSNALSIDDFLDNHPLYSLKGARISRQAIFKECFGMEEGLVSRDVESAYRVWASSTKSWKKVGAMRIQKKVQRGFERILSPGEASEPSGLNIVESDEVTGPDGEEVPDHITIMRNICREHNCRKFGDVFPSEGLSKDILDKLMDEGCIYESLPGVYRVALLP